jgi:hypothetical protein
MKRKTSIILFLTVIVIFLSGIYFYYQNNFLEDEYRSYSSQLVNSGYREFENSNSVILNIESYDKSNCELQYCILNDCNNKLVLPCSKEQSNEFTEEGTYELLISFRRYPLFPFSKVQTLKKWSIEEVPENNTEISSQNFLNSIKNILEEHYIWKAISIVVNDKNSGPQSWIFNSDFSISYDYFKSIYLLNDIANRLDDDELKRFVSKEIEYINQNKGELLNKRYNHAEAYIVKLIEIGLEEDFLKLYDNFNYLDTRDVVFEPNYSNILAENEDLDIVNYSNLVKYVDYKNIFSKEGYEDLSNYYNYLAIDSYNSSNLGIYGLCSLINLGFEGVDNEELIKKLNEEYSKDDSVFSFNISDSIQCKKFISAISPSEENLLERISLLIDRSTLTIDDSSYIIDKSTINITDTDEKYVFLTYNLLNNLLYIDFLTGNN